MVEGHSSVGEWALLMDRKDLLVSVIVNTCKGQWALLMVILAWVVGPVNGLL
jgi:hypothetical protein